MATKKNDSAGSASKGGGGAKKASSSKAAGGKEKSLTELVSALAEKAGITKAEAKEVLDAHAELLIRFC